jgi:fructose-1,6-bisphosphatase
MARQGDIVAEIIDLCPAQAFDLTRAEGRADWDDALRAAITELAGDDETLKRHAGDMIAQWRRQIIRGGVVDTGGLDGFIYDEKNGELRF